MAYCVKCGTQLSEGDNFCPKCGNPCDNVSRQSVEAQVVEQKEPSKTLYKVLLAVILAIALIGGGWFAWSNHRDDYSLEGLAKAMQIYNTDNIEDILLPIFHDGLARVYKNEKYGFIDMTGKEVVPCIYYYANDFHEGLAKVGKENNYGYIDKTGKEVVPCKYFDSSDFHDGLAWVYNGENGYSYIDKTGKEVITCQYDSPADFHEGLASVQKEGKYGYIDKNGKEVIPCIYDSASDFYEGLASVRKDGKFCYIDKKGKTVIENLNVKASDFHEGLAIVTKDDLVGFIDKTGKEVIPRLPIIAHNFNEGLARVVKRDNTHGFIDKTGKEVILCIYDYASDFHDGLAWVRKDEKYGYIDKTGKEVIPFIYDNANDFSEGLAFVVKDGLLGVIDKKGNSTFDVNNEGNQQDGNDIGDDQELVNKSQQEEKEFLENFYKGLENISDEGLESYIRKNVTSKALQTLRDEFPYDCDDGDCLATWLFSYQAGSDCGSEEVIKQDISWVEPSTYLVSITYKYGDNDTCEYRARIGLVKDGDTYKIDTIVNVLEEEQEEAYREINQYSKYVGKWRLRRTTDEGRKMLIEITLKENHSGELAGFNERGNVADVLIYEQYPQCILEDGVIYMTKNGDINERGVPKLRVASDGLYSYDGEKYIRQSE